MATEIVAFAGLRLDQIVNRSQVRVKPREEENSVTFEQACSPVILKELRMLFKEVFALKVFFA